MEATSPTRQCPMPMLQQLGATVMMKYTDSLGELVWEAITGEQDAWLATLVTPVLPPWHPGDVEGTRHQRCRWLLAKMPQSLAPFSWNHWGPGPPFSPPGWERLAQQSHQLTLSGRNSSTPCKGRKTRRESCHPPRYYMCCSVVELCFNISIFPLQSKCYPILGWCLIWREGQGTGWASTGELLCGSWSMS